MWADSQCDREIEESSFSDLYQESSKLGGQGSMFRGEAVVQVDKIILLKESTQVMWSLV